MRAISLFSGIGGLDKGFEKAGIETVLQAESDPHALKVLARHWPDVERVTDVRDVGRADDALGARGVGIRQPGPPAPSRPAANDVARESDERNSPPSNVEARGLQHTAMGGRGDHDAASGGGFVPGHVDLIFGGFPCQDISVAGRRAGLSGERSGLWFEFHRVLAELRPRWCVIENVPGLFSSNEGRDFAVILDGLDELGYGVAWRVLDAQHFGVPQRRRRVFIVGGPGDGTAAAAVLAVRESGSGNLEESRETREGTTGALSAGTLRAGGVNGGNNPAGGYLADVAHALRAQGNDPMREDAATYVVANTVALRGREGGATAELGGETANALRGSQGGGDKPYALIEPIPFDTTQITPVGNYSNPKPGDPMHPLAAGAHVPAIACALAARNAKGVSLLEGQDTFVSPGAGVRRLTPLECTRLMGFPDDWLDNGQADSHRYRQLGNAVCVPVAEYIGHRLMRVNALLS